LYIDQGQNKCYPFWIEPYATVPLQGTFLVIIVFPALQYRTRLFFASWMSDYVAQEDRVDQTFDDLGVPHMDVSYDLFFSEDNQTMVAERIEYLGFMKSGLQQRLASQQNLSAVLKKCSHINSYL